MFNSSYDSKALFLFKVGFSVEREKFQQIIFLFMYFQVPHLST